MSDAQPALTLSDEVKAEIRKHYETLATRKGGFTPRASQRRMIAEVAKTLAGENGARIMAIEAPTGVGKSLAYLIPAIAVAKARKRHLVVSTGTVALQEQLIRKDLPDLIRDAGLNIRFHLAKGRGRYVCDRELSALTGGGAATSIGLELAGGAIGGTTSGHHTADAGAWHIRPEPGEPETVVQMAKAKANDKWSGDFDDWRETLRPALRSQLTTTAANCGKLRQITL
ncbi:MAG: hypothetical protein PF501_02045 [Salinisphaera sp.]|jgi:ATP-dependent DNA helicase DinG|nr:hypothetical protein [Salinisphaera sp.]